MKKRIWSFVFAAAIIPAILCGCSAKLTTVRPAEISEMRVERISDGAVISLPLKEGDADIKDRLIFQLEEPYAKTGKCTESDGHLYRVELYIGDKRDTEVIINEDGSVCRNGKRYVASEKADSPVKVEEWSALFADNAAPSAPTTEAPAAPTETTETDGIDTAAP